MMAARNDQGSLSPIHLASASIAMDLLAGVMAVMSIWRRHCLRTVVAIDLVCAGLVGPEIADRNHDEQNRDDQRKACDQYGSGRGRARSAACLDFREMGYRFAIFLSFLHFL
ncbi:MAG: hypothetical protein ACK4S5_02255, partial [Sphingobium yanoikuyae]